MKTSTGSLPMPWFRCLVRGENFPGELAAHSGLVEFYVTRFMQAPDASAAESLVVLELRSEPKLSPPPNYLKRGIAQIVLEEIEEVKLEQVPSTPSGFIWYPMESNGGNQSPPVPTLSDTLPRKTPHMKNTKQVTGRRAVRFDSLDEMLADAEGLASGPITTLGNWSPGQIFEHLARAYTLPLDGVVLPIPFYVRWGAKLMLGRFLRNGLPAGLALTGKSAEALVPHATTTEAGLAALRDAVARWKAKSTVPYHSVFGTVTDEQFTQVHLRHAELHMSFLTRG